MNKILIAFFMLMFLAVSSNSDNIENVINTNCDELSPVISPDGKTLYYCKTYCSDSLKSDDIYFVVKDKHGKWGQPKNIGKPLNNSMNNFVSSVSPDGHTLLLGTVYPTKDNKLISEGVSISHKTDSGWSYPVNQVIEDYYNISGFAGFYLSNDSKTLLMTIERNDTKGKKDLYVSFLKESGIWSKPLNLGGTVNSVSDEISPFLASDGETMYFSSEGHEGFGSSDIFMSRRLDDTWQNWSKPVNLGEDINTPGWDAYFKLDASAKTAFLVRKNEQSDDINIYKIQIPEKVSPKPVLLVKGKVISYKSKIPLKAEINFNQYNSDVEIGKSTTNASDGLYAHTLPGGLEYTFNAQADGYLRTNQRVDLVNLNKYDEVDVPIELIPASDTLICLRNIFFKTAKSAIDTEGIKELKYLTKFLKENMDAVVEITGYTDNVGTILSNIELSQKRAEEAKDILVNHGIEENRIIYKGKGPDKPVVPNETKWGRALNRRIEFKVFRKIS